MNKYDSNPYILEVIGNKLKAERIANSYTQQDVSNLTGISVKTLSNIERGNDFSFENLIKLLKTYNLVENLDKLFSVSGETEKQRYKKSTEKNTWVWGDEK